MVEDHYRQCCHRCVSSVHTKRKCPLSGRGVICPVPESRNPHLFLAGADVVDWLFSRVEGFKDRRDARKYASSLLKHGYLRHTVNKITFSEQCYYTFGDLCQSTAASLERVRRLGERSASTDPPPPPSSFPFRHGLAQFERGIQRRRL